MKSPSGPTAKATLPLISMSESFFFLHQDREQFLFHLDTVQTNLRRFEGKLSQATNFPHIVHMLLLQFDNFSQSVENSHAFLQKLSRSEVVKTTSRPTQWPFGLKRKWTILYQCLSQIYFNSKSRYFWKSSDNFYFKGSFFKLCYFG